MYVFFLLVEKVLLCCLLAHFGSHRSCSVCDILAVLLLGESSVSRFMLSPCSIVFFGAVWSLCVCVYMCTHILRVWCAPVCVRVWGSILFFFSHFPSVCVSLRIVSHSANAVLSFCSIWPVSDLVVFMFKVWNLNSLLSLCNMLTLTSNFLNLGLEVLTSHLLTWPRAHFVSIFWKAIFCWQVPNGLRIVLVFQLCHVGGKLDHYPVLIRTGSCVPLYCLSIHFIQVTPESTHPHM